MKFFRFALCNISHYSTVPAIQLRSEAKLSSLALYKSFCNKIPSHPPYLVPNDQLAARVNEIDQDKDRDIVLYCRSGRRSSLAKRTLESLGYTNVLNAGGYEPMLKAKWTESTSQEIAHPRDELYSKIHAFRRRLSQAFQVSTILRQIARPWKPEIARAYMQLCCNYI